MKKKNRALYMWSALAAVAITGAVLDDQWDKRAQERKVADERILQLDLSTVRHLELTLENPSSVTKDSIPVMTNKLSFAKSPAGWMIKTPVEELADQNAVNGYIEWVVNERASQVAAPEPIKWATFGLDKPKGSIQLKDDQGRAYMINVSSRKNFEGDAYLRRDSEEKVLLANAMWFSNIGKTLYDFRDKKILKVPVTEIKRFQLKNGKEVLAFERAETGWGLTAKPTWKIDQNRVRELLATLTGPVILEYKREGAIQTADLKEFVLEKPRSIVEVEVAEGLTWTAEFSEPKDQHYFVRVNDPSMIVSLNSDEGAKLTKYTAEDFRDRKAPFNLARDKVKSLELKRASKELKAEREKTEWRVSAKVGAATVDGKQVSNLIEKIRNLEVAEFLPSAKTIGAGSETQLVLKDEAGVPFYSLIFGALEKIKAENGADRAVILARTSLSEDIIGIDMDQFEALGLGAMLGEAPPAAGPTTPSQPNLPSNPGLKTPEEH